MLKNIFGSEKLQKLRDDAERRLKDGTAPSARVSSAGAEALALLYHLASNSDSASDALKLLHELQVNQVELDLQHEQLEANEHEVAQALARYKEFYHSAPIGYFIIGLDGKVIEWNQAGARLLEIEGDEVSGRSFASLLADPSRPALKGLLKALRNGSGEASCEVHSSASGDALRLLRIAAAPAPGGAAVLMVISELEGSKAIEGSQAT
ncbi:MAG: PAS domain-containing protein [Lysobacterales bacterium]